MLGRTSGRLGTWFLVAAIASGCRPLPLSAPPPTGVAGDVAYLASPQLAGRAPGTPGGDSAAAFIARRYQDLGLRGAFRFACRGASECAPSFFQPFRARGVTAKNVAAVIPGADSALRDQYIIVGAHYDHLGRSSRDALDRELGDVVRPGADDNASGSAAVLELARRLAVRPVRRSVLVIHFDAEEWGLIGSDMFVEHMPIPRASIVSMLNMDMVGRLRGGRLMVDVSSANAVIRGIVDSAAATVGVPTVRSSAIAGRSDHASFRRAGVPVVALFTGFHSDYHRVTDTAARIDVPGILRIVDVAEAFVRIVGDVDLDRGRRN